MIPFATADTKVCVVVLVDGIVSKHCIVNVLFVTSKISINLPLIGSVDLGYVLVPEP